MSVVKKAKVDNTVSSSTDGCGEGVATQVYYSMRVTVTNKQYITQQIEEGDLIKDCCGFHQKNPTLGCKW